MGEMDQTCRDVMGQVDGAIACCVVDLATGLLVGFHGLRRTPALEEAMARATLAFLRRDGAAGAEPALEVHVSSSHGYHLAKVLEGGRAAVMLLTNRAVNTAISSAQLKAVIPKVEPELTRAAGNR
jgi:hypothetical protein